MCFILNTDDRSRVVLQLVDNDPNSDYVNASFIDVSSYFSKDFTPDSIVAFNLPTLSHFQYKF